MLARVSCRGFAAPKIAVLFCIYSCVALLVFSSPATAQQAAAAEKNLTVERLYSAPSLTGYPLRGIEWLPDGVHLSYFRPNDRGGSDLVELDAATNSTRVLVSAGKLASLMPRQQREVLQRTGAARAPEAEYIWSPDGKSLLFRGGGDLVLYTPAGGEVKNLVSSEEEVGDVKFSPDGQWVSYTRGYDVWAVNVTSGQSHAITTGGSEPLRNGVLDWVYPEELSLGTAYWWSPDSKRIAYLQFNEGNVTPYPIMDMATPTGEIFTTRFPEAGQPNPILHAGVISVKGGETTWLDTGSNTNVYLARVKWLPDSQCVAVERLDRAQKRLDLLFADASTGASKIILTDTDKYWINISNDLYFFSDGKRFIWSDEHTGFRHLYVYGIDGTRQEALTSGEWQVSDISGFGPGGENGIAVDEANGYVYFPSNKDDAKNLQFYRVSISTKTLEDLTKADGTHMVRLSPSTRYFVDTYSTANAPPRQDVYAIDGRHVANLWQSNTSELAQYHLSPVKFLKVAADDGTLLYAKMILPRNFDPAKKYPVLINVYGGPEAQEVRSAWGGIDFLWHEMMAEKGCIIFALDNRGSYGRGHAFETPIYHHFGRIELKDQLAGVRWLKSQPYVDGSRIGIWGWSYGGYMTLYSILNAPNVFKAAVSVAPVTDWKLYDTIYTERYMGTPQENPEGYRDSSDVTYASHLSSHLMEAHGTGDDNVHFANTAEMLNAFIDAGKYPEYLLVFPGRGHPISDRPARIVLFDRITEFFLKNL